MVLALLCLRLVLRKLQQVRPGGEASAAAARRLVAAIERGDAEGLSAAVAAEKATGYQLDLLEAAIEALSGGGDVGAFVHTATLDARHQAISGVRVIRGMATLAGTAGLLGAMVHHFALIHGDHGPGPFAWAAAEESANRGALLSMGLGLGTALGLFAASRTIRRRVIARLTEITDFGERIEAAVARSEQWTAPSEEC